MKGRKTAPSKRWMAEWRAADRAFARARTRAARAEAMVSQLRCRELVERLSWAQRALPGELLRRAMEVGAISWRGAIERLGRMDFVTRHAVVRSLLETFPDEALAALFALVRAPQAGDGAIWFRDEAAVSAVAVRLARAGQGEDALAAIGLLEGGRAAALAACAAHLERAAVRREARAVLDWLGRQGRMVQWVNRRDLFPLLAPAQKRVNAAAMRALRAEREADDEDVEGVSPRCEAAVAFAGAGLYAESEEECLGLSRDDEVVLAARLHPPPSRARLCRRALSLVGSSGYWPHSVGSIVEVCPELADEAAAYVRGLERAGPSGEEELAAQADALLRIAAATAEPSRSALFHEAFRRIQRAGGVESDAFDWFADRAVSLDPRATAEERAALVEYAARQAREREEALPRGAAAAEGVSSPARGSVAAGEHEEAAAGALSLAERRSQTLRELARYDEPVSVDVTATLALAEALSKEGKDRAPESGEPDMDEVWSSMAHLADPELRARWAQDAAAEAWRRTIDLDDDGLFAFLPFSHWLHAEAVLRSLMRLGGRGALPRVTRMLRDLQAREP